MEDSERGWEWEWEYVETRRTGEGEGELGKKPKDDEYPGRRYCRCTSKTESDIGDNDGDCARQMAAEAGRVHASETDESGLCRVTAVGSLDLEWVGRGSWRGIGVGDARMLGFIIGFG